MAHLSHNSRFRAPAAPVDVDPSDGVVLVDKPAGPTSHDVVARIKRRFGFKKVGHGGTLDPAATGLLIILIGKGTKLSSLFMGSDKKYEGTISLGVDTDSQDADGEITRERDWSSITPEMIKEEAKQFIGDIWQTPPMVSAKKVNGVPLYKKARRGEVVEREARLIHVYEFSFQGFELPEADFIVRCTKGTYVRTLCADLGDKLGCGAHLCRLRRLESGGLSINDALTLDKIEKMERDQFVDFVMPVNQFV